MLYGFFTSPSDFCFRYSYFNYPDWKPHHYFLYSTFGWQLRPFNPPWERPSLSFSQPISPIYFNPLMFGCQDSAFLHTLPINILFEHHLEDNSEEANFISSSDPTSKNPATLNTQRVIECSWPTWIPWQNWRGRGAHQKCKLNSGLGQGHSRTSMDQGHSGGPSGGGVEEKSEQSSQVPFTWQRPLLE